MEPEPIILQKESIKLTKNTRGYNWEIKLHINDTELGDDDAEILLRIKSFDNKLKKEYAKEDEEK